MGRARRTIYGAGNVDLKEGSSRWEGDSRGHGVIEQEIGEGRQPQINIIIKGLMFLDSINVYVAMVKCHKYREKIVFCWEMKYLSPT